MIKEDGTKLSTKEIGKKVWEKPEMTQLSISNTKSGLFNLSPEFPFFSGDERNPAS